MLGHPLIKSGLALAAIAAISAGLAMDARAFTETKVPPAISAQPSQSLTDPKLQLQKPESGTGLELTSPGDAKSKGTELNIPGVGSIGTIPKLDFGLELLYGDNGGQAHENNVPENKNDDVLIKGTIKHRF